VHKALRTFPVNVPQDPPEITQRRYHRVQKPILSTVDEDDEMGGIPPSASVQHDLQAIPDSLVLKIRMTFRFECVYW